MKTVEMNGLDGLNPLGFLAALGLHRILSATAPAEAAPRMHWASGDAWHPVFELAAEVDPVQTVMAHLETSRNDPALEFNYTNPTGRVLRDLKPPPELYRGVQREALTNGADRRAGPPDDHFTAFAPGTAVDGNGNTKPTAFHFTAGKMEFLNVAREIALGLQPEHVAEALYGAWRRRDALPQLRWDAQGERNHALLGYAPGKLKPTGNAGADWLAFQALPLFPTFVGPTRGGRLRVATTGFERSSGDECLVWPLWAVPASLPAIRALVQHPGLTRLTAEQRTARGVRLILRSTVRRSTQGYGSLTPPEVLPPGRA